MNIGKGHWIFAIIFFAVFAIIMIWAYTKDKKINKIHYKGAYKIIGFIILLFSVLYAFVKIKSTLK